MRKTIDGATDLVRLHTGEAEHAYLVCDVLPVPAGALLGQACHQLLPHGDDTVSHALNIPKPANKHRYIINT